MSCNCNFPATIAVFRCLTVCSLAPASPPGLRCVHARAIGQLFCSVLHLRAVMCAALYGIGMQRAVMCAATLPAPYPFPQAKEAVSNSSLIIDPTSGTLSGWTINKGGLTRRNGVGVTIYFAAELTPANQGSPAALSDYGERVCAPAECLLFAAGLLFADLSIPHLLAASCTDHRWLFIVLFALAVLAAPPSHAS